MKRTHSHPVNKTGLPVSLKLRHLSFGGLAFIVLFFLLQSACKKKQTEVVPVPSIASISKNVLNIGDTLIIKGANFNTNPSANLVSVASVTFPVMQATDTQLMVIVPKGAQSGQLSVGFAQGQSVSFSQLITIVGSSQPFIKSISPAQAYENDTVVIKGGNFAIPYNVNTVTFNGTAGTVINVTDSVIRVIVPDLSQTGPVTVTTNGLNSLPYQYNIAHIDPAADGNLFWMIPYSQYVYPVNINNEDLFCRGLGNSSLPQGSAVYDLHAPNGVIPPPPNPYAPPLFYPDIDNAVNNIVVNDAQQHAYYLTASAYPFPAEYKLMRLNLGTGGATTPTAVLDINYAATGKFTTYYANPEDTVDYPSVQVPYTPNKQLSMDGSTIYIKMGISDDYYVGDVSAGTPQLTLQKNVFGDPLIYMPQFGKDYIFYQELGSGGNGDTQPDYVTELRYMRRGTKTGKTIPLNLLPNEYVMLTLAGPSHGNVILFVTMYYDNNNIQYNHIYKFDADAGKLTLLYDEKNWKDATPAAQYEATGNSGFFWLGSHIYYTNNRRSTLYTGLYRLNDNGITPKIYTVYGHMEPTNIAQAQQFLFFTDK